MKAGNTVLLLGIGFLAGRWFYTSRKNPMNPNVQKEKETIAKIESNVKGFLSRNFPDAFPEDHEWAIQDLLGEAKSNFCGCSYNGCNCNGKCDSCKGRVNYGWFPEQGIYTQGYPLHNWGDPQVVMDR